MDREKVDSSLVSLCRNVVAGLDKNPELLSEH
jgi:hypothetical protein